MRKIANLLEHHAYFVRFLFVGSINTLLDFFLYFIFANLLSLYPVIASILSTGLTMCVSFYLNHHFVFRSSKKKRHTVARFVGITLFNVWVVQSVVIFFALNAFRNMGFLSQHHWTLNLSAKLCGVAVSFMLNFLMYRYIFHEKQSGSEETIVL